MIPYGLRYRPDIVSATASSSRPLLDDSHQRNGEAPQRPPLVEQKTNRPKKKALKRLQDVSESFRLVFSSIRVFADSGTRHNTERDLFVTDYGCANRLQLTEQDYSRYPQTVEVPFHSLSRK